MSVDANRVEKREQRMLSREGHHRKTRSAALSLAGVVLVLALLSPVYAAARGQTVPVDHRVTLLIVAIFGGWGYAAHLKLRHIETIRFHLERRRFNRCPRCGYDLGADPDGGCPECGWRRAGVTPAGTGS